MLRECRVFVALIGFLLACSGCTKPPPDLGIGPFQGEWKAAEPDSKTTIQASFEKDRVQIMATNGPKMKILAGGNFRVNKPELSGEIDIVETRGANVGKTHQGIFAFEDSKLKICLADLEKVRPADFVAKDGCKLMVFDRVK